MSILPIHAALPDLLASLRVRNGAVLVAPPGAGKTTAVPLALLAEPWCNGGIIVLSPRRVAARAAAERMAATLGEAVGDTVGYATRLDSKRSAATRITVMTEAIFVATILADPELPGVSAVLFDEAHERHLDSDLGLALAVESQAVLRPDLRLLAMSATIDGARFAALLGDAPVIESQGAAHPLRIEWLGARPEIGIDAAMAAAIATAWRDEAGDILAFLPGVGEIARTAERLTERRGWGDQTPLVLPLHGQCEPAAQRAAIARDPAGRRRIVLATAIAESSLTLDGVALVVDSGLARRAEFDAQSDKAAGVTRLVTRPASQAATAQRAGRAARQGPGVAYRLWAEAAHAGRPAFDAPEMLTSDLAPLALVLAQWGAGDPAAMAWIDPPPPASLASAQVRLTALGALRDLRITAKGRALAALPMAPELAHMLLFAASHGAARTGARLALLLQERGLGGRGDDLAARLDRWNGERGVRAQASRKLAAGWARRAEALTTDTLPRPGQSAPPPGILLAEAFPDNIARARDPTGEHWLTAGGRGLRLDPASPLARAAFLAVGEAQGEARGARITGAIALTEAEVLRWLPHRIARRTRLDWLADERRVEAVAESRLGAITLARGSDPAPDPAAVAEVIYAQLRQQGLALLALAAAARALLVRAEYAGIAALAEPALLADLADWLGPLVARRLDAIDPQALYQALEARLDWNARAKLDAHAPAYFTSPAGTTHAIAYDDPAGPSVTLRVQALFGLDAHPHFGQPPRPLLLHLTSPAARPIQTTADLPAFWRGTWRDVAREMRGRYPRHRWPDDPWGHDASLKTKAALARSSGARE